MSEQRTTIWVVMKTENHEHSIPVVAFRRKRRAENVAVRLNGLNYDTITGHSVVECSLVEEKPIMETMGF